MGWRMKREAEATNTITPGKSCHGLLLLRTCLNQKPRNPTCIGFTRDVPNLDEWYAGEAGERAAAEFDENVIENRMACFGAASYPRNFDPRTELPRCIGLFSLYKKSDGERRRLRKLEEEVSISFYSLLGQEEATVEVRK